jgi:hypothetical protein
MRPLERGLWSVWAGETVIHPKGGNRPQIGDAFIIIKLFGWHSKTLA